MGYLFVFLLIRIFEPERFFGSGVVWDLAGIGALLAGCMHYFPLKNGKFSYTPITNVKGFYIFVLFLLLLIISLFRTHSFLNTQFSVIKNVFIIVLFPTFIYFYHQYKNQDGNFSERSFILLIIHVLGIFCLANFLAFVLNPTFSSEAATTFRFIGINTKKFVYPLYPNSHPTKIGSLGGFLVVLSAGFLKHAKPLTSKERLTIIVYICVGFIIILMSDSRANLFAAILSIGVIHFLASANKLSLIKYAVWLLPFSNILFIGLLQSTAKTSFMSQISRSSSSDISTGNSRKFIYMAANNELAEFKPIHVVGFGEYGPYGAGITKYYMEAKFGYSTKEQKLLSSVTHNTALQVIFDIGYVGLVVYLLLLVSLFGQTINMFKDGKPEMLIVAYLLTYILINGTSGTYFGNYNAFQNYLFIIISFFVFISYNAYLKEKKKKESLVENKPVPAHA